MKLIDLLNWLGKGKTFRPAGRLLLWLGTRIPFSLMVRIAGRRIVTAFAGAPAILSTGVSMERAVKDPRLLYEAIKYTAETLKLDTLCLLADMSLEAEACGCQVHFYDDKVPSIITNPIKTEDDLAKLDMPDPYRDGRMPVFLATMQLMKKNTTMLRIAEVSGPFTLATNLGGTDVYLDIRRKPEKVRGLLKFCEKVIIRYGKALIKSGADMILIGEPTGSQLSVSAYEEFSLPYTKNITKSLKRQCILHICGKAGHIIDKMCQSGAAAISIDEVDIDHVIKSIPRSIVIAGNISPLKFSRSSPEAIAEETAKLKEMIRNRKEFLVAPGCDLAPQTPLENILSFVKTVKSI